MTRLHDSALPGWLRTILLIVATAILCSCRSPQTASNDPFQDRDGQHSALARGATSEAQGVSISDDDDHLSDRAPTVPVRSRMNSRVVLASSEAPVASSGLLTGDDPAYRVSDLSAPRDPRPNSSWAGPAVCTCSACATGEYKLPPSDEVLCDGGDEGAHAVVLLDGTATGVEMSDTVAHYRTHDGRTLVVPSNEVCIYAPRFGSVRQVAGASMSKQRRGPEGLATDQALVETDDKREASTTLQRLEPSEGAADRPSSLLSGGQKGNGLSNEQGISRASSNAGLLSGMQLERTSQIGKQIQALQLAGMMNAISWSHDLGIQIVIDRRRAQVIDSDRQAAWVYRLDEPNHPRMSIIKVADRASAHPGEVVHFELQFENVGNRPIHELTLIDNLTTRLEYVDGSQKSDLPTQFTAETNTGGSLVLRWELQAPIEAGRGGRIEFDCRVR